MIFFKKNALPLGIASFAILCGLCLYRYGLLISGPFIFGDEYTYFSFARDLYQGHSISLYTQYGPLYPLLISAAFIFKNVVLTYQVIRDANILLCISAVIPAYLLAKELFQNLWLRAFLPLCIIFTPFSGFVHLIWSEPLYIPLFYWTCLILFKHTKNPNLFNSMLLGILLSSLYYTKPGAGLVTQIVAMFTLAQYAYSNSTVLNQSKKIKRFVCIALLTCFFLDMPWFLHYHFLGASIIGYPSHTAELASQISKHGYYALALSIFLSVFYQFSYVFIGSWGLVGIGSILLVAGWNRIKTPECHLFFFILSCISGLILLSALGMSSHSALDYRMPNGRYFSAILPMLITIILHLILKQNEIKYASVRLLSIVVLITTSISIIAPPLYTLNPVAYTAMPELSSIIFLKNKGLVLWGAMIVKPSFYLRFTVGLFFGSIALCSLIQRKYVTYLIAGLILIGTCLNAIAENYYVIKLGDSQSAFNHVYIELLKHDININNVALDITMKSGNAEFMTPFWMGHPSLVYLNVKQIEQIKYPKSIRYFISTNQAVKNDYFFRQGDFSIYKL